MTHRVIEPVAGRGDKLVVVSAVNLVEGGTLTILRECLRVAAAELSTEWRIVALVHDRDLIDEPRVELLEIPAAKRSWFRRVYEEWVSFDGLSRSLQPDLWVSLHDITPRVHCRRQVVYCHNPAPFYRASWREARFDPSFLLFNLLYHYLYKAFIHRNAFVIVQQAWLRTEFRRRFGSIEVVVAHPDIEVRHHEATPAEPTRFLYPSFPRVHKNFETLCEATRLVEQRTAVAFEVRITVGGSENAYARWLHRSFGHVRSLRFIGLQSPSAMAVEYAAAAVVVFPGKLETWGLPITEAKAFGRPLLVSDLPYAHETVGDYQEVSFFPATDASALAELMLEILQERWSPDGSRAVRPEAPFAAGWSTLWQRMIRGL